MENPNQEEIKRILTNAKRIAIVGLSGNSERTSYQIGEALQNAGYEIIPVNPNVDEVLGVKAISSLKELEEPVDIINVFRRSEFLPDVAKDAEGVQADVFWTQLGLYNEEAYEIAKRSGFTVVMDRCIKVDHAVLVK
ncbi:CoA-binding protein [Bacillus shivajii]|uniref:CoA-binding protein n=1 Tax=Bacillus shivajii TaxID=1983719 RepID=UPI00384B3D93